MEKRAVVIGAHNDVFCRAESRAEKLWIPSDSPYISNKVWLDTNFPRNNRHHSALFVANSEPAAANILTPDSLLEMLELHKQVVRIRAHGKSWEDLCYRIPIADIFLTKRKRRQTQVNTSVIVEQELGRVPKKLIDDLKTKQGADLEISPFDDYYSSDYDYFQEDPVSEIALAQDQEEIVNDLPPDIYCDLVETLNDKCLESSLLEIWRLGDKHAEHD